MKTTAPHSSKSSLHRIWQHPSVRFLRFTWQQFNEANVQQAAGSLTFTTLLALVPLLTVMVVVLTAFPMFGDISAQFMAWVNRMIVPSGASAVADYLNQFKQQAGKMTAVGIIIMMVTSLMLIQTIDQTLNRIWRVARIRAWWISLPMYWALLTIGPILVGMSLSLSAYGIVQNTDYLFAGSLHFIGHILGNTLLLFLLYRVVPNCHVPFWHALLGAFIIGALLETAKWGFGIYIAHFNSYAPIYGAFAIVPIFLVWLHLLWLMILTGALVIASASNWHKHHDHTQPTALLDDLIALLLLLTDAQQHGKTLTITAIRRQIPLGRSQIEQLLLHLAKAQYVAESKHGWLLKTSPEQIWLSDLFRQFVYDAHATRSNALLNERMAQCQPYWHINLAQLYQQP